MDHIGKFVFGARYLHTSAIDHIDATQKDLIENARQIANVPPQAFNVVKIDTQYITLLNYPLFSEEGFPSLREYWTVYLPDGPVRYRTYENSANPPILHRKELLLPDGDSDKDRFTCLTQSAEQIGLFDDPHRIGFRHPWNILLKKKGYKLVGHDLLPLGNEESSEEEIESTFERVERHRTALTRYDFSAPLQSLARFGFLDGIKTVFDYGCGRGDDLRNLLANNVVASGWDPHYAPDAGKQIADIVNLGFVINVIENLEERATALCSAYILSKELLVVSAMLCSQEAANGKPYSDGILTARNTFQKYYSQDELRAYIAEQLNEVPIPVGPGIFYVFKNKESEQRFMYGRQQNRRTLLRLSYLSRPQKPSKQDHALAKYAEHKELLESLWEQCLSLGRTPDAVEVLNHESLKLNFGSIKGAMKFIFSMKESAPEFFEQARQNRINDLSVYFSQIQFEKRKPYRQLEPQLQRDVKAFFSDYKSATARGRDLLHRLAQPEVIDKACAEAAEKGVGWYEPSDFLQLHSALVPQLPPELRAYIACGTALYGDVSSADVIKIHIRSGKLTLMRFDDFTGKPLPRMIERTKIKLREQDIDYFLYGDEFEPPFLYKKSRYIDEEFPGYAEQVTFDEQLTSFSFLDLSGYGPAPKHLEIELEKHRWTIQGSGLTRSKTIPDLDAPCGLNFKYRHLIECGETQKKTGLLNHPIDPESYTALFELAEKILDPVIDYFGMIELTYGFCSAKLAKEIPERIAPKIDQHASHEISKNGQLICQRLGASVDFLVAHENMEEVAEWIIENLPFDRLYFYGTDRPIHVSFGPDQARSAFRMQEIKPKHRVPRPFQRVTVSR